MRTHTTLTLRSLVVNDMDVKNGILSKQQISVWMKMLPEITGEMYNTIYFLTHSIFVGALIRRQLTQIHKECISLLDKVEKHQNLPDGMDVLKAAIIKCINSVMEKLENDCSTYLDDTVQMPLINLRKEQGILEDKLQLVEARLMNFDLAAKLRKVVLEGMNDVLKVSRCAYYRMNYIKDFQSELIEFCKQAEKKNFEDRLIEFLIRKNYNSGSFVKFYHQKLQNELAVRITDDEQMAYLYFLQRDFERDSYRKSALSYDINRKRIKHLLAEFVRAELAIREKRSALNKIVPMVTQVGTIRSIGNSERTPPSNYKIRTVLTVDGLAYFIKLMITAKVIEPGVRTELLSFIASIFQTPGVGTTGISPTSLGAKYKQVVQSTANTVRTVLVRMLKILDDEFAPV